VSATARARRVLARVPIPILVLFAMDLAMAILHVIGPLVPAWAARGDDNRDYLWDLDAEGNAPSWYSTMQLGLIGVLMLGLAAVRPQRARLTAILALAGLLFLFLSLDEQARLHEKFGSYLDEVGPDRKDTALDATGAWMLIVAPAFLGVIALGAYAGRDLLRGRRAVQALYAIGLVIYVGSFAGLELLLNFMPERERQLETLEETGEMIGATLLLWATYELLRSHGIRIFARDAEPSVPAG
jgi:hypothetical protein